MNLSKNRRVVLTLATGGLLTLVMILLAIQPGRAVDPWQAEAARGDGTDCLSSGRACATNNGVLGEADFGELDQDTTGTHAGAEDNRALLDADVTLANGWSVSPASMHVTHDVGDVTMRTLTISNDGPATLAFEVVEQGMLPVQEGLVAYYPFNGNANDESGNGHDGTVEGATLIADRYGEPNRAYSFDGLNDHIAIDDTSTFNFLSGGFTLVAWASFVEYNSDNMIVGKHNCGSFNGYNMGVNSGRFQFYVSSDPRLLTMETYQDDKWHFVVGVYDEVNQYLHVDSVLRASQPKVHANPNDLDISLGRAREGCGYFNGEIDDVRIYDRALTEAEVQSLYEWEAGGDVPWLFTDPISGTIPAYNSVPIEVTFDATGVQPGDYTAGLIVQSNDPVTPTVSVPVTMTVEPTPSMGWVEGSVTDAGTGAPLEATIIAMGQPYTITTEPDTGSYIFWLDEGSYTLQVTAAGYFTTTAEVEIVAQQGTIQDFSLALNVPVMEVSPGSLHVTHDVGDVTNRMLTISNDGPATLAFEVVEQGMLPVQEGLVAYYPFNGNANDESENGNDGTVEGATLATDRFGNPSSAYSFDGVDDYVSFGTDDVFRVESNPFTVEMWIKPTSDMHNKMIMASSQFDYYGYFLALNRGGGLNLAKSGIVDQPVPYTFAPDNWYHIAAVQNFGGGVPSNVEYFVNGASIGLYYDSSSYNPSVGKEQRLASPYADMGAFHGLIDDVCIYDRALTAAEIQELRDWKGGADVRWLSTDPISGTVSAYSSVPIQVTFDATATQPGTYNAEIVILSNDPVTPTATVPVTMTVEPTAGMGWVEGTVTDAETDEPLEATIIAMGQPYTITTDPDTGSYTFWLDAGNYTLQVTAEGHVTETTAVEIVAQQGITQDFGLDPLVQVYLPVILRNH